jgi:hypothetical protein
MYAELSLVQNCGTNILACYKALTCGYYSASIANNEHLFWNIISGLWSQSGQLSELRSAPILRVNTLPLIVGIKGKILVVYRVSQQFPSAYLYLLDVTSI